MQTKQTKLKTSIMLTPEGKRLLRLVAERLGVSESAAMEIAVREKAKREGVK